MAEIFEHNLSLLEQRDPELAHLLRWTHPEPTPLVSAQSFVQPTEELVCYVGIDPLTVKGKQKRHFLFERAESLRAYFAAKPLERLFEDPHIAFHLVEDVDQWAAEMVADHPSIGVVGPGGDSIRRALQLARTQQGYVVQEFSDGGAVILDHLLHNLPSLVSALPATALWGAFRGIPAVVCGAGPSLDGWLDQLGQWQDRALLLAGGSSLTALTCAGLQPHFGAGLDPNPAQVERVGGGQAFEAPFFYTLRLHPEAVGLVHGPRLYVPGADAHPLVDWAERELGLPETNFELGPGVLHFLVELAMRLGCDPIILVGADLAFVGQSGYASGVGDVLAPPSDAVEVGGVQTLPKWVAEGKWLQRYVARHPHHQFYRPDGGLALSDFHRLDGDLLDRFPVEDLRGRVAAAVAVEHLPVSDRAIGELTGQIRDSLSRCRRLLIDRKTAHEGERLVIDVELEQEVGYTHWVEPALAAGASLETILNVLEKYGT